MKLKTTKPKETKKTNLGSIILIFSIEIIFKFAVFNILNKKRKIKN